MQQQTKISDNSNNRSDEEINRLKTRYRQDFKLATQANNRVEKMANFCGLIEFVTMSYFLHSGLLTSGTGITAHLLTVAANIFLSFICSELIREFHPSRITAASYWQSGEECKKQLRKLEQDLQNDSLHEAGISGSGIDSDRRCPTVLAAQG